MTPSICFLLAILAGILFISRLRRSSELFFKLLAVMAIGVVTGICIDNYNASSVIAEHVEQIQVDDVIPTNSFNFIAIVTDKIELASNLGKEYITYTTKGDTVTYTSSYHNMVPPDTPIPENSS